MLMKWKWSPEAALVAVMVAVMVVVVQVAQEMVAGAVHGVVVHGAAVHGVAAAMVHGTLAAHGIAVMAAITNLNLNLNRLLRITTGNYLTD